jgi:nucleotide-binding universal stress UspA family protein
MARQAREIVDYAVAFGLDDATGVAVEPVVSSESAVRALLRESEDAQLLVLGSRGLGGFARLMLGSVSHQCLLYGTSDIAVVRAHQQPPVQNVPADGRR